MDDIEKLIRKKLPRRRRNLYDRIDRRLTTIIEILKDLKEISEKQLIEEFTRKKLARYRLGRYYKIERRLITIKTLLNEMKNDPKTQLIVDLKELRKSDKKLNSDGVISNILNIDDEELKRQSEQTFIELLEKCPEYFLEK